MGSNGSTILNLATGVFMHAATQPQRTAIVVDERAYTYDAFARLAGAVATWLRARVAQRASDNAAGGRVNGTTLAAPRVGILAGRSIETYAGIVGAAWAGGTYVPLNPKIPASRLAYVIGRAKIDVLIADAKGAPKLDELAPNERPAHVLLPADSSQLERPGPALPPTPVAPDHPAYIIFTSGTTGVPKGVVVTVANIAHTLASICALYHIGPADRVGQFIETTFDPSILEMFACWQGGAELHVLPETKAMAPGGFIRQRELTVTHAVPSLILMMQKFKQLAPGSMPSLRLSFFGGEGLPVASARLWQQAAPNAFITNQYGPTEAAVACISQPFTDPPVETAGRGTLAIGTSFPGMTSAIVDENDPARFLPAGEIGELALSGPQLAAGYLGDEEQTARRFPVLQHPILGKSRWYLTGDSAYCDEQGLFHCLGRIDNQVKVMGHRVELEEIEAHLRVVCKTDSVAAVAWPVVNGNPAGIVAFVGGGPAVADAAAAMDVREAMKRRVPFYMVPSRVHAIDALPLSSNGKVDRKGLRTMLDEKVVT